jgi:outer membrane protein
MVRKTILAAVLALSAPAAYASGTGVVDFTSLQKSPVAQKAMAKLNEAQGKYQKELQTRSAKLEEAQKKNLPQAEIARLRQQFEKELQDLRTKGEQEAQAATNSLQGELEKAVKTVAAEKKLDMVFRKEALLYGGTDITADVEKELAAQAKK